MKSVDGEVVVEANDFKVETPSGVDSWSDIKTNLSNNADAIGINADAIGTNAGAIDAANGMLGITRRQPAPGGTVTRNLPGKCTRPELSRISSRK